MTAEACIKAILKMNEDILGDPKYIIPAPYYINKVWDNHNRTWGLVNFIIKDLSIMTQKNINDYVNEFFKPYLRAIQPLPGDEKSKDDNLIPQIGPNGQITFIDIMKEDQNGQEN